MTRQEQLRFCKSCLKRHFDPRRGIVCSITDEKADFSAVCPNYQRDENVELPPVEDFNNTAKKNKTKSTRVTVPKVKEKIRLEDIYLILGVSLINTFLVRLIFFYNLSSDLEVFNVALMIFTFILIPVALFLRNKTHSANKFISDLKFNLIYVAFLTLLLILYSLLMGEYYSFGKRVFAIILLSLISAFVGSIIVKPIRYFIRRKNEKTT